MKILRWLRKWYDDRRYPMLSIFPDGSIVRMRDGKVIGHQDQP